jgi:hypothetical protein
MRESEKVDRFRSGPVFLFNEFEGCMIRTEFKNGRMKVFVKFEGEEEFEGKQSSTIVTDAIMEWNEVSREQYESY